MVKKINQARSRLANEVKKSKSQSRPDPEGVRQAKAALAEAKLEKCISEVVAAAPPLAPEVRARLQRLLSAPGDVR